MAMESTPPVPLTRQFRNAGVESAQANLEAFKSSNILAKVGTGLVTTVVTAAAIPVAVPASVVGAVVDLVQSVRHHGLECVKEVGLTALRMLGFGAAAGATLFVADGLGALGEASLIPLTVVYVGAVIAGGAPVLATVGQAYENLVTGAATAVFGWASRTFGGKKAATSEAPPAPGPDARLEPQVGLAGDGELRRPGTRTPRIEPRLTAERVAEPKPGARVLVVADTPDDSVAAPKNSPRRRKAAPPEAPAPPATAPKGAFARKIRIDG